jgi:hypothetical protein
MLGCRARKNMCIYIYIYLYTCLGRYVFRHGHIFIIRLFCNSLLTYIKHWVRVNGEEHPRTSYVGSEFKESKFFKPVT